MTQFNATPYEIERLTGTCAFTGRTLEPGETYIATLVEVDEADTASADADAKQTADEPPSKAGGLGLRRVDVSIEAWDEGKRPDRLFSYWKSTVPMPNEKKKMFVDDGVLMNLFLRLGDSDNDERLAFRFVLGLILMRKKMLRYDRTEMRDSATPDDRKSSGEWWIVTPKVDVTKGIFGKWDDDNPAEMFNPDLDEAQVQQVSEQLGEILEGEL